MSEPTKDAATLAREYGLSVEQFFALGAAVVRDFAPEHTESVNARLRVLALESGIKDALRSLGRVEMLSDAYYARRALETTLGGDLRHHTYNVPGGQMWVQETTTGLRISAHGTTHGTPPLFVAPECANVVSLVFPNAPAPEVG